MTSQEAQSIIKRLCNHATKEAKMHGIDLNFADGLILSLHDEPYNKFRIGINANIGSYEPDFYILNEIFNANDLRLYNTFNGNFYFFNQDEFAHNIEGENLCVVLDLLVNHAGAYFEFPNPNAPYWQAKRDKLDKIINDDCEKLMLKCKHQNKNVFATAEYQALLSKYKPMLKAAKNDFDTHASPIRISLVPASIANFEQLMVWLDLNDVG